MIGAVDRATSTKLEKLKNRKQEEKGRLNKYQRGECSSAQAAPASTQLADPEASHT